MYSIGLILPYFLNGTGSWPSYIDWFFASCKANETIDFHVFTDDHAIDKWSEEKNIYIHHMSFQECVELIKRKVGIANITRPYKLCDFRHAYGVIFEDWMKGYDYWGFHDCDLLFGNLRKYYTDELLEKYEKLMLLGHLQLTKNTTEVNEYYKLSRPKGSKYEGYEWDYVFSQEKNFGFDEWSGVPQLVRENNKPIFWERLAFSNIYEPQKCKRLFDKNVKMNRWFQVWQWNTDGVYHIDLLAKKKTERLYIHLTQRKMEYRPYMGEQEIYITEKSKFQSKVKLSDGFTGFEFFKLYMKKIFIWVHWHLTHLKGKQPWEM